MKTKKDRSLGVYMQSGQAQQQLWLAVAEAAGKGMACCSEAPTLDAALYNLTLGCADAGLGIDDDLRASMALSEAAVAVKPARWRKGGFAYGIKQVAGRVTVRVPGKGLVTFADWTHEKPVVEFA